MSEIANINNLILLLCSMCMSPQSPCNGANTAYNIIIISLRLIYNITKDERNFKIAFQNIIAESDACYFRLLRTLIALSSESTVCILLRRLCFDSDFHGLPGLPHMDLGGGLGGRPMEERLKQHNIMHGP